MQFIKKLILFLKEKKGLNLVSFQSSCMNVLFSDGFHVGDQMDFLI